MAFGGRQRSISSGKSGPASVVGQVLFGGVFVAAGILAFIGMGLGPLRDILRTGNFNPAVLFFPLFPLIFVAVGALFIRQALRGEKYKALSVLPTAASGAVELKPGQSGLGMFIFALIFALFWNGIVSAFLIAMLTGHGNFPALGFLFLLPFVAVGIGLIGFVGYSFLALFNPKPHLRLNPGALPLGAVADLEWTIVGSPERIRKMTLWLEGREEAQYRQGTRTVTASSLFEKVPVFETDNAAEMRVGKVQIAVPEFTMHSLVAPNNRIKWSIKVHGEVHRWPDVNVEFPITVLPLPPVQG